MTTAVIKRKSNAGRLLFDGKPEREVLTKLEYAFAKGCNILEACCYADISHMGLYRWIEKNPEFRDRIKQLQNHPTMKAKMNVVEEVEMGDVKISQWYLEKKQGSGFNGSDYDKNTDSAGGQSVDNQGLAVLVGTIVGSCLREYVKGEESTARESPEDL